MNALGRLALVFLALCGVLVVFPTSWLITPHRMFVAATVDGRDLIHFERTVPFPLYLRATSAFMRDERDEPVCEATLFTWFSPGENGLRMAEPWPPHCQRPPEPGRYRIYAEWSLCVARLCARPERFVSEPVRVTRDGRYLAADDDPS